MDANAAPAKAGGWFDAFHIGQYPVVFAGSNNGAAELTFSGACYLAGSPAVGAGHGGMIAGSRVGQNAGLTDEGQKVVHKAISVGVAF